MAATLTLNETLVIPFAKRAPLLPLDIFPEAIVGISTRLLRSDYSGALLRARTTLGEADIMPNASGRVGLDSLLVNLDSTATGNSLTESSTLSNLCSVGVSNYSAYVPAMYNQGTLENLKVTQTTAASQPRIVNAGVLEETEGLPVLYFDGVDDYLTMNGFHIDPHDSSYFSVQSYLGSGGDLFTSTGISTNRFSVSHSVFNTIPRYGIVRSSYASNGIPTAVGPALTNRPAAQLSLLSAFTGDGNISAYSDNLGTAATSTYNSLPRLGRSARNAWIGTNTFTYSQMYFSDLILLQGDYTADRATMWTAINRDLGIW